MATKERDRATSNYKLARTAVHDIYVGMMVTDDRSKVTLMQDPAVRPVRDFLLGRILNYQRGFIKKNPADMTVRLELADIQRTLGRIALEERAFKVAAGYLESSRDQFAAVVQTLKDQPG